MPDGPTEAPACRAALTQATVRWPGRRKASDGILSSAQHRLQNPRSDHDHGLAFDLTHDPERGVDCHRLARWVVDRARAGAEPRATYVIWNRQIASAKHGWTWRAYSGPNPHTKHMHVSITPSRRGDTSPWWDPPLPARPPDEPTAGTTRPPEEDVMASRDELRALVREELDRALPPLLLRITGGRRVRASDGTVLDPDKEHVSLADVLSKIEVFAENIDRRLAALEQRGEQ